MASTKVVLTSLSVFLGIFFIFIGIIKLTPKISIDLYKDLRTDFVKYAKVFPITKLFGLKIESKWYRRSIGIVEIICGLGMAAVPHKKTKTFANIILLIATLLGVYSHYMVSDPFEKCGRSLVFTFLLCGRLVVSYQISLKEANAIKAAQAQTNGLKQD